MVSIEREIEFMRRQDDEKKETDRFTNIESKEDPFDLLIVAT
jgi:hypothetical protein